MQAKQQEERTTPGGRVLKVTPVYESYWRFAAERQEVYLARLAAASPPWTSDPILQTYRFTNVYRASDRVSQFLIRRVIYDEPGISAPELVFRILLFKLFNREDTWQLLCDELGEPPTVANFTPERYAAILDSAFDRGSRLYSGAYIMPSPSFGHLRKHRNHLHLLNEMLNDSLASRVQASRSLEEVYRLLLRYRSIGPFLAYQLTIDLNYSPVIDFSESDFVVAGPGAKSGIAKCFAERTGLSDEEVIRFMADSAETEFKRFGLSFNKLGGTRNLQLIDCQNLFCETDKYARVAHPSVAGTQSRTRIKQRFSPKAPLPKPFFPPKWKLGSEKPDSRSEDQLNLAL